MTEFKEKIKSIILEKIKAEEVNYNNYLLPESFSKKITTYMSMKEDIVLCKKSILKLIELKKFNDFNENDEIENSLNISSIIMYCKCFMDASKSSKSKLEIRDCFSEKDSNLLALHQTLMNVRNGFVAHRGDNEYDQSLVYFQTPKTDSKGEFTEYKIKSLRAGTFSTDMMNSYLVLFNHIEQIIEDKLQIQIQKIHSKISSDYTFEGLESLLIK